MDVLSSNDTSAGGWLTLVIPLALLVFFSSRQIDIVASFAAVMVLLPAVLRTPATSRVVLSRPPFTPQGLVNQRSS